MDTLEQAFRRASPRLNPRPPALASLVVHGAALGLALLALGGAFFFHGILVWSAGLAFIAYDTALLLFVAWQTLPLLARPQTVGAATRPSLGVVIAAYNEDAVLERTIDALLAQEDPPETILIADDGSRDGTARRLAQRYGFPSLAEGDPPASSPLQPGLVWLRAPHGGKARTLNRALAHIATDVVVTVDADTLPAPDALARMRLAFAAEPGLVAATGVLTPVCDRSLGGRLLQWFQTYEYVRNFIARFAWMRSDSLLLISGAFAGFRREALLRVGGFDPQCLVEDYEVIHRLHRHAADQGLPWRVRVLGGVRARTSAPSTLRGFLQQRRRWFAGFLQTQYWNRDMAGNPRFGKLGTLMLPVKAMDTVQPFCGLAAFAVPLLLVIGGRLSLAEAVLAIVSAKLLADLAFHAWILFLYKRWTGHRGPALLPALLATVAEPFSFQLLRHTGAILGWHHFLTGRRHWGRQRRHAMAD